MVDTFSQMDLENPIFYGFGRIFLNLFNWILKKKAKFLYYSPIILFYFNIPFQFPFILL